MDIDGTGKLSKSLKAINHLLSPATRSSRPLARQHDYWLIFILLIATGAASVGGLFRFWWKRERQQRFCEAPGAGCWPLSIRNFGGWSLLILGVVPFGSYGVPP